MRRDDIEAHVEALRVEAGSHFKRAAKLLRKLPLPHAQRDTADFWYVVDLLERRVGDTLSHGYPLTDDELEEVFRAPSLIETLKPRYGYLDDHRQGRALILEIVIAVEDGLRALRRGDLLLREAE